MKLRFTPEAERRALAVAAWWRQHGMVRDLFDLELVDAQVRVTAQPGLGAVYREVRGLVIRRILLSKTAQHLYYSVDEAAGRSWFTGFWGARRGGEPKL